MIAEHSVLFCLLKYGTASVSVRIKQQQRQWFNHKTSAREYVCRAKTSYFKPVWQLVTDESIHVNKLGKSWGMFPQENSFKLDTLRSILRPCLGKIATRICPPLVSAPSETIWSDWTVNCLKWPPHTSILCMCILAPPHFCLMLKYRHRKLRKWESLVVVRLWSV